jgi:hypothetical protein
MFCQLYLLSQIFCNPDAEIVRSRIDITEYICLNLALSQCSLVECDRFNYLEEQDEERE